MGPQKSGSRNNNNTLILNSKLTNQSSVRLDNIGSLNNSIVEQYQISILSELY